MNEPLTFGMPLVIDHASSPEIGLDFNLSLTPYAALRNGISLASQLVLGLQALAGNITVAGEAESFGPLVTKSTTINLGTTPCFTNKTFAVAFQSQNVTFHNS